MPILLGLAGGLYVAGAADGLTAGDLIGGLIFLLIGAAITAGGEAFQIMRSRAEAVNRDRPTAGAGNVTPS